MKSLKLSRFSSPVFVLALTAGLALSQMSAAQSTPAENATSQPPPGGVHDTTKPTRFNNLDTNSDGKLSRDEVVGDTELSRNFAEIDTNGDGYISRDELNAYMRDRKHHSG